ncbi:hypothetical protein NPIL_158621 [Nephila pilipes]|uniref:Uncharacterized protein n=1 Tax=Nephila pilipes TaxID=299642 RepID=A0A8X6PL71_NEPPI|nr:hypothetical protein NPIL_158621 [Nephila pilipes]
MKHFQRKALNFFYTRIRRDYVSRMDSDLQIELCKEDLVFALQRYLYWPLQTEFLEMASRLYPFLNKKIFFTVLNMIVCKRNDGKYGYFDYSSLLTNFWLQGRDEWKKDAEMPNFYYFTKWDPDQNYEIFYEKNVSS